MSYEQTTNTSDRSTQVEEIITELANCRIPSGLYRRLVQYVEAGGKWLGRNEKHKNDMRNRRNGSMLANVSQHELTRNCEPTLANGIYNKKDTLTLKKVRVSKKVHMPDTFSPNQEWAREDRGWDQAKSAEEAERFVGYCRAHGKKYADWDHAWRNWCRSPYQGVNGNGKTAYARPKTSKEQWGEMLQSLGSGEFLENALGLVPKSGPGRQASLPSPSGGSIHQLSVRSSEESGGTVGATNGAQDLFAKCGRDRGVA